MAKGRVDENRVISDAMNVLKWEVGNASVSLRGELTGRRGTL